MKLKNNLILFVNANTLVKKKFIIDLNIVIFKMKIIKNSFESYK